jgi:hypothetical protein
LECVIWFIFASVVTVNNPVYYRLRRSLVLL